MFHIHFALNDFISRASVDHGFPCKLNAAFRAFQITACIIFLYIILIAFDQMAFLCFVVFIQKRMTIRAIYLFCFDDNMILYLYKNGNEEKNIKKTNLQASYFYNLPGSSFNTFIRISFFYLCFMLGAVCGTDQFKVTEQ